MLLWSFARLALALWGLACIAIAAGELLWGEALASVGTPSAVDRTALSVALGLYGVLLLCSPRVLAQAPWVYAAAVYFAVALAAPPVVGFDDLDDAATYVLLVLLPTGLACTMIARERYGTQGDAGTEPSA